jgi:hypothetical protein
MKVTLEFQVESDVPKGELEAVLQAACENVARTLAGYQGADGSYVRSVSPIDVTTAGK